jgi:hypothetical protein
MVVTVMEEDAGRHAPRLFLVSKPAGEYFSKSGPGQMPHSGGGFLSRWALLQFTRAVAGLSAVSVAGT